VMETTEFPKVVRLQISIIQPAGCTTSSTLKFVFIFAIPGSLHRGLGRL
jgi:hypothetical protein